MVSNNRITQDAPELREVLLGFLESASSLCDMMNTTMAAVLNEIMSIQAVGTLPLMVPKLRSGSYFPTDLFERWGRTDRALAAAVAETCVAGTSTRKVERVAAKFGAESLSKDQVSRPCAVIDGEVGAFLARDWSGTRLCHLFPGAAFAPAAARALEDAEAVLPPLGGEGAGIGRRRTSRLAAVCKCWFRSGIKKDDGPAALCTGLCYHALLQLPHRSSQRTCQELLTPSHVARHLHARPSLRRDF